MYQLILVIKLSLVKNFKKYFLSHFEQIIAFSLIVKVISRLSTITLKLAKITHFPMAIFYISIYFIINVFLNDATRFCSKMPLIGDSCCTETCRARQLRLFRRNLFFLLEISVNVNQHRTAIGVLNNGSFITITNLSTSHKLTVWEKCFHLF